MEYNYVYRGQDITLDIMMKIEAVVRIIAGKMNCSFDEALYDFYSSRTYTALQNTETVMWAESSEFIADDYFREKSHK